MGTQPLHVTYFVRLSLYILLSLLSSCLFTSRKVSQSSRPAEPSFHLRNHKHHSGS